MNSLAEPPNIVALLDESAVPLRLPLGLLGFEPLKEYVLLRHPGEEPFRWLQSQADPGLAFLVVSPFDVVPDYSPDVSEDDCAFLGLESPEDAALFNIVTLRPGRPATVNLKGPIVINVRTFVAKQVVLTNASDYAVQHPLSTQD
jgi:flagellar assembly factor FliW